jgi:hypothetical protein
MVPVKGIAKTHPCDDTYENLKTGACVTLATTPDAHFRGLRGKWHLKRISEVTRLPGVKVASRTPGERVANWWKIKNPCRV